MQIQPEKLVVGIQHRADIVPLTEDEVRFEIDMCIGCDRCMRACPVPLSSTVNIADLNLATISDVVAPHVARFTQAAPGDTVGRQGRHEPGTRPPAARVGCPVVVEPPARATDVQRSTGGAR